MRRPSKGDMRRPSKGDACVAPTVAASFLFR